MNFYHTPFYQLSDVVVECPAPETGSPFNPRPGHIKDCKDGTHLTAQRSLMGSWVKM